MPAMIPQKAELTPSKLKPDAVTMKVMNAASLFSESFKEVCKLFAIVVRSAMPTIPIINDAGNAAKIEVTVPQMRPTIRYVKPETRAAI